LPTDFQFRLATCINLALACICLGYSEWDLVAYSALFTAVVIALIFATFFLEGRVVLSRRLANAIGFGIAVITVAWLAFEMQSQPDGFASLMMQTGMLLPYVGPFLMVLIPAKKCSGPNTSAIGGRSKASAWPAWPSARRCPRMRRSQA